MKLVLLSVESAKSDWFNKFSSEYVEKISRLIPFEVQLLRSSKVSRENSTGKLKSESVKILESLKASDFVILLDETGTSYSSIDLAKTIERTMNRSPSRIVFVVGGAFGVDDAVKARAQLKICLSPLVLNHLLAQAVTLEAIYRSFAILKNLPYHNE